jgi:hypothetical protein
MKSDRDRSGGPRRPEEGLAAWVARRAPGPDPGPCPDPDSLAGFFEQRLLGRERAVIEAHLAACGDCRGLLWDLSRAAGGAPALGSATRSMGLRLDGPFGRRWAAAAILLLAVAAGLWRWVGRGAESDPDLAALVRASLAALAVEDAGVPQGFEVPSIADLSRPSSPLMRGQGGLRLLAPREAVLEAPGEILWSGALGAASFELLVLDGEGRRRFLAEIRGDALARRGPDGDLVLAWPVDAQPAPGDAPWTLRLRARAPAGELEAHSVFRILDAEEARRHREAAARLVARLQGPACDLALAHLALARGLFAEALPHARAAVSKAPSDAFARATLWHVLDRLASPEADRMQK